MLEANDMVEAKLAEIRERKMYEMKRMFAAKMYEGVGGLTKADIEARRKAGYKRASEVLGDPRDTILPGIVKTKNKNAAKKKLKEDTPIPVSAAAYIEARRKQAEKEKESESEGQGKSKAKRKADPKSKDKEPSTIAGRFKNERKRWSDKLDKLSARHLSKHDVEGGKSAWERSAGGKISSVVKPVAKTAGHALGVLGKELGSIGFSNLE